MTQRPPALVESMLGRDNYRDIVAVLEALARLASRGAIGLDLQDAVIEVLADDLVCQQLANDVARSLLPIEVKSADTARSEEPQACRESNYG